MTVLYPEIEPYDHGMLDVGDGNLVYWEVCGNLNGKPAVVLHGGPGSGCSTGMRRYFDPQAYRTVLFDQRSCGRSLPHASDLRTDLSVNTTAHLLADMEQLRQHLGIDKWLLFGGSWGSTLGLAYAERHPQRVTAMVLGSVTTTRRLQPAFQLAFARIVTHYFSHDAWLDDGMLLRHASALAHIPGILVHGRLDLGNPLVTAWELAQAWPNSELVIVSGAGHSATDPGMSEALIAATNRFTTHR